MKNYIGAKIIKAEPMTAGVFADMTRNVVGDRSAEGYGVLYPDGYKSWSPKDVFENAYREVTDSEIKLLKEKISGS